MKNRFNGICCDVIAYALVLSYGKTKQNLTVINFIAREGATITYAPPTEIFTIDWLYLDVRGAFFRVVMELLACIQTDEGASHFDGFFRVDDIDLLDRLTRNSNAHLHSKWLESAWDKLTDEQRWTVRVVSAFFFESLLRRTADPIERQRLHELRQELVDERALPSAATVTDHAERLHPGEELVRLIDYVERLTWSYEPPVTGSKPAILYGSFAGMLATQAKQLAKQHPETMHA